MRALPLLLLVGCTAAQSELHRHIRVLSSDEFQGRKPGTPGEEKTVAYLIEEFRAMGLETRTQPVPLVGITTESTTMSLGGRALRYQDDFMAWTKREVPEVHAKGELVFVGYGAVAPEYGWDDYKGLDCRGKILECSRDYTKLRYHKPQDEYDPSWDLSGAAQDAELYFELGRRLAESDRWPEWSPTSEFRSRRKK